ncbi:MAG: ABC transporter permease, partial [Longimicrobiales bacterium]
MRGLTRISGLSLDVKLGARMLSRYPGVTLVGGIAMAIGVGLGAGYLEVVNDFLHPTLPLPEGDRIVGIQNWDAAANDPELRSLHDFVAWRDQLESVQDLGAYRTIERNLGLAEGAVEPVRGAEITPSAFRVARVPARLGRALLEDDAQPGAAPVVVLGHELWRARFGGDGGIVGRTVRLGTLTTTVVGVMPAGFAFPVNHDFWVPLRTALASAYGPREGPGIQVFGRLAPGVSRPEAQAELSALAARAAAENPQTHEHLRPRVVRYTELFVGEGGGTAYLVQLVFVMLLLVLSSNVATLMFARTATRENEIVMRYALGGSRRRIIAQFFVEALVLALIATAIGLAFVAWGTGWVTHFFWQVTEGQVPFWLSSGLNATTVLYALALAFICALVAGVIPALKTTRARVSVRLRHPGGA